MIESEADAKAFSREAVRDPAAFSRLEDFAERLTIENSRQNLVSSASLEEIWKRHIADSLQLLELASSDWSAWLDLGTGAGPPGLVIAIARPDLVVHLVESRKKRIDWLQSVCLANGLSNCHVEGHRLENVESFPADVISARAFAPLEKLLSLSSRFSTGDTTWLLPKGRSAQIEVDKLAIAVRGMFHVKPSITDLQAGIIVGKGVPAIP